MNLFDIDKDSTLVDPLLELISHENYEVLDEKNFKRRIATERKRTERSRKPFLLMLLNGGKSHGPESDAKTLDAMISILLLSIRETDVIGWYKDRTTVGIIFTCLEDNDKNSILAIILGRVNTTLRRELTFEQFNGINISFHFFPDDWLRDDSGRPSNPILYPDLSSPEKHRQSLLRVKQGMDIIGSALILALCSPLFLVIALAIKASCKGPVLYRQERVGQYGKRFIFLKFRSMYTGSDTAVHKEYVTRLIAGEKDCELPSAEGKRIYKLTNDSRVTRIGKFLRKTSLDELPQLVNVLKGDMSLVGPRPAIPYEVAAYQTWHRRRVLEVKPGMTGLWQVCGRCQVKFDEMVRLDLRYATSWSPWLDLKILMRTPRAVIGGSGAA